MLVAEIGNWITTRLISSNYTEKTLKHDSAQKARDASLYRQSYGEHQATTEEALKKVEILIQEIIEARRQQSEMGFDATTFSIYWTLKQEGASEPKENTATIRGIFDRFPDHRDNRQYQSGARPSQSAPRAHT